MNNTPTDRSLTTFNQSQRTIGRNSILDHLENFRKQVDIFVSVLPAEVSGVSTTRVLTMAMDLSEGLQELRMTMLRGALSSTPHSRSTPARARGIIRSLNDTEFTRPRGRPLTPGPIGTRESGEQVDPPLPVHPIINQLASGHDLRVADELYPFPAGQAVSFRPGRNWERPSSTLPAMRSERFVRLRPTVDPAMAGFISNANRFIPIATPRIRSILQIPNNDAMFDDPNDDTLSLSEIDLVDTDNEEPVSPSLMGEFGSVEIPDAPELKEE